MKIKKLKVFKSRLGEFEIIFEENVNILTGVNGTGKSTIMKMLNREELSNTNYEITYTNVNLTVKPSELTSVNNNMMERWGVPKDIIWDGEHWQSSSTFSSGNYRFSEAITLDEITFAKTENKSGIWYSKNNLHGTFVINNLQITSDSIYLNTNEGLMHNYRKIFNESLRSFVNEFFIKNNAADYILKKEVINKSEKEFKEFLSTSMTNAMSNCVQSIDSIEVNILPLSNQLDTAVDAYKKAEFKDLYKNTVNLEILSDGQKRSILTSLIFEGASEIVLLDEPTNFLANEMVNILSSKIKETQKQVIIITHRSEFIQKLYNKLPQIIRLKLLDDEVTPLYLPLKEIKEAQRGNFSFSLHAPFIIESLFSKKVLILEGIDEIRGLKSHKEIFMNINNNNWSLWNARGGSNIKPIIDFCEHYDIDYLAISDSDVDAVNQLLTPIENVHLLSKPNLESFIKKDVIKLLENEGIKELNKQKKAVKKMYDEETLIYTDEFYNEISDFLFGHELKKPSEFLGL